MDNLPSDVQSLIHRTREQDGPNSRDKERVGQKLSLALIAAGGAAGIVATKSATAATALLSGEAASAAVSGTAMSASSTALVSGTVNLGTASGAGVVSAAGAGALGAAVSGAGAGAGALGAGVVGVGAGKAAVAPTVVLATKWGGSTIAAWLVGASVIGAGAISAPRVVHWVNAESRSQVEKHVDSSPVAVERPMAPVPVQRPSSVRVQVSIDAKEPVAPNPVVEVEPANVAAALVVVERPATTGSASKVNTPTAASSDRGERDGASDSGAEVALLSQAQRALASGDASGALSLLREHARRFPTSALSTERSAARVFAYCQLGRVQEAQAAARVFFGNGVGSPLTPKVQASCINSSDSKNSSTNPESAGD